MEDLLAVFREMLNVRYQGYKAEQERQVPLYRTIMWCWFFVAMYFSYGSTCVRLLVLGNVISALGGLYLLSLYLLARFISSIISTLTAV